MKAPMLLTFGAAGGALAAFLVLALDAARPAPSPAGVSAGAGANDAARPEAAFETLPLRVDGSAAAALREALAIEPAADRFRAAARVAGEWAFVDPAGFFAFAEAADSIDGLVAGLDVLIATDPERVFAIAARFNGPGRPDIGALYLHAIRGMAGRDPAGTIARLEPLATGAQRDPIMAAIAEGWAATDTNAALAWAMSVVPPSSDALGKVIESVAAEDLLGAVEMLRQVPGNMINAELLGTALIDSALAGRQSAADMANALVVRTESEAAGMLSYLMQLWTVREPEAAVAWMAGNEAYLSDALTRVMVARLAFEDVALAAELAAGVPASAQEAWLDAVANRYGQFDVEAGMSWLAQYAGIPAYEDLRSSFYRGAMVSSPEFVADYIETSGEYFDQNFVVQTAARYVQQNPDDAAAWAMGLDDPDQSDWALEGVVDRWSQMDGESAADWVMSQPRGLARDRLLDTMLLTSAINPELDPEAILGAYQSESSAQRTLAEHIFRSTRVPGSMLDDSLARAESLLEHLTDPVFRRQAEAQIAAAR